MKYFKQKRLTLAVQDYHIRSWYLGFSGRLSHSRAVWIGELQPTELSAVYKIKIEYALGDCPDVYVLRPELQRRNAEEPIPHMFDQERLCLYYPYDRDWTAAAPIADTIIPWASLWLYFYEIWYITGEWLGKGIHLSKH